jgi:hypothetical protein
MKPEEYRRFTEVLKSKLEAYENVLGLIALGSMSDQDVTPDEWSDHDFFVIVQPGHQEFFRTQLQWLPNPEMIVFSFRETAHGVKVLYRDAHLLEFAIFDPQELHLAQINRYQVLFDRANLENVMQSLQSRGKPIADPAWLFGQFLTNLLVGVARFKRGEQLSGHFFVKYSALRHLLLLCHLFFHSEKKHLLDDLDPFRRFELVFPEIAESLNDVLQFPVPEAASRMLKIAAEILHDRLPKESVEAIRVVQKFIDSTQAL